MATYLALKSKLSVDINDIGRGDLIERLSNDIQLMVDCLWLIIEPSAAGITPEQFIQSLDGETLSLAFNAMLEGIVDFFPPAKRDPLRNLLAKMRQVETIVADRTMKAAEAITTEQILSTFDKQSSKSQESQA